MTQFGPALCALNSEIIRANSSQAKGRVERANRTLQDRLVKELRLAGVSDMAAANAFLPRLIMRHNLRFARAPARSGDLHRPLNQPASRLKETLCVRDQRQVGSNLVVPCGRAARSANMSRPTPMPIDVGSSARKGFPCHTGCLIRTSNASPMRPSPRTNG